MADAKTSFTLSQFKPLAALMLGYACLMLAGGMNSLIVPIRGESEGFSTFVLGLLGTSWAVGFIIGAFYVPVLVLRVGHVRVFSVMASMATLAVITSLILIDPLVWIPMRAAAGFCFAGSAMIVESWVNERTDKQTRGKVFGVYTMVNLTATTAGQMLLITGDTSGPIFFLIAAVFYTLAIIPPALSGETKPKPLQKASFDLKSLWENSRSAVVSIMLIGVSNSAFGSLGAIYAQRQELSIATIATFMSITILTGALMQMPVGYLSDRFNRRIILVALALIAACGDIYFIFISDPSPINILPAAAIFGAAIYSLPPVVMAHANDHADANKYLQTSSGMLLLFGCGSIMGPFIAGLVMGIIGIHGLFVVSFWAHTTIIIYVAWRLVERGDVKQKDKSKFLTFEPGRVILQPNALSIDSFGFDRNEKREAPPLPDRILDAFDKPPSDDDQTKLEKNRPGDDTHGGW